MQITNGRVIFTRTIRPADFEKKEASVELSFTIAEGESPDAAIEQAARTAQEKALQMVGLKPSTPPIQGPGSPGYRSGGDEAAKAQDETKERAAAALNAADPKPDGRRGPRKPPTVPAVAQKPDPAAVNDVQTSADAMKEQHAQADAAAVTDEDLLGPGTVPEITDQDIQKYITQKNGELIKTIGQESPVKIRKLIVEFVGGPPKGSRDIPQPRRQEFLDKLKALS